MDRRALDARASAPHSVSPFMLRDLLDDLRHHDSLLWRRAINAGVSRGPEAFVRLSPPLFGLAFAAALPRYRRVVLRNLRLVHGTRSAAIEALDVARVFSSYASCLTDAFVAGSERGVRVTGECVNDSRVAAAIAEGKGLILTTAHIGGWQIAGLVLSERHHCDLMVVMRPERDPRAQALQDSIRDRIGIKVAHIGTDPLDALPLLAHLQHKGAVAVQMDRLPEGMRGRMASLFGRPWAVPEGPLRLAALSGAPILPVFSRRLGFMRYEVHIAEPIHLPRRPSSADLDGAARAITGEMEKFVRAHPTQWFHFEQFE
jgi:lauroyl/myristoyl acyltransferase